MTKLKGVSKVSDVEFVEIPQTPIKRLLGNFRFIHTDYYNEGLNYSVSKKLINDDLKTVEEILGESVERVEDSLSAREYMDMIYPLITKVLNKVKGVKL